MAVAPISIKVESEALRAYLKAVPGAIARGMAAAATRAGKAYLVFHRKKRLSAEEVGPSGPLAGTKKGFIGGRTIFVTGDTVETSTLSIVMKGGPAKIHETGGVMTAKGKLLTVPMPAAKDAQGKVTKKARQLLRESASALDAKYAGHQVFKGTRQFRALTKITSRVTGKQYLVKVDRNKRGLKSITYFFHLEKSVRVKPRLEFIKTWKEFEPKAIAIYRQMLPHAIRNAGKKMAAAAALRETVEAKLHLLERTGEWRSL